MVAFHVDIPVFPLTHRNPIQLVRFKLRINLIFSPHRFIFFIA